MKQSEPSKWGPSAEPGPIKVLGVWSLDQSDREPVLLLSQRNGSTLEKAPEFLLLKFPELPWYLSSSGFPSASFAAGAGPSFLRLFIAGLCSLQQQNHMDNMPLLVAYTILISRTLISITIYQLKYSISHHPLQLKQTCDPVPANETSWSHWWSFLGTSLKMNSFWGPFIFCYHFLSWLEDRCDGQRWICHLVTLRLRATHWGRQNRNREGACVLKRILEQLH